jgi:site-specific DNA-methyltransferase (adenine-specific)
MEKTKHEKTGRQRAMGMKIELYNDHFQNFKSYGIPKAQLIIADIPYNLGNNAYASNPAWYKDGDYKNGESDLAGKKFFDTDKDFRPAEFMHFCSKMMKKEPKAKGQAPAMIVFCEFEQQFYLIQLAKKYGLKNYINLVFRKNFSAQVLKANMKVVSNAEYGLLFYRDKLPKFNNHGKMIFNIMDWEKDTKTKKIHPTQKPIGLMKKLIEIFTDPGEVVIDPVAGSAISLIAAMELGRQAYGFEIKKNFYKDAVTLINEKKQVIDDIKNYGYAKEKIKESQPILF